MIIKYLHPIKVIVYDDPNALHYASPDSYETVNGPTQE